MGRSGRLSIGAIAAAVAAGQVAPNHLAAAVALGLAAVLLLAESRPRLGARSLLPVLAGAGLIVLRLAVVPAGPAALDVPPDGGRTVDARRRRRPARPATDSRSRRSGRRPDAAVPFTVAATLPRYPVVIPGDRVVVDGSDPPTPRLAVRLVPRADRRGRDAPVADPPRRAGPRRPWATTRGAAARRGRGARPRPARAGGGTRRGDPDRPARRGRPGPRSGVHDRRRQPRRRDLRLEHRDRRGGHRRAHRTAGAPPPVGRDDRRDRRVRRVRGRLAIGRARRADGRRRPAGARERPRGARERGPRLGGDAAARHAIRASIGDAGFQLSSLATAGLIAWATPLTGWIERAGRGRVPRWLAESLGVSLAAQAATLPIILVSFGRLAILSPVVNLVVVPLVAPAMAAGVVALAGGGLVLAGAPPVIGAIIAAPGWVILRVLVAIVTLAAGLPFASVTLEPPLDVVAAAVVDPGAGAAWCGRDGRGDGPAGAPPPPAVVRIPGSGRSRRPRDATGADRRPPVARRAGSAPCRWSARCSSPVRVVAATPGGGARISVLDVGQGDAILVEGSRGGRLLIDGGPDPDRLLVALDRRIPPWDRRIDAIILSHPHEDHVAGPGPPARALPRRPRVRAGDARTRVPAMPRGPDGSAPSALRCAWASPPGTA